MLGGVLLRSMLGGVRSGGGGRVGELVQLGNGARRLLRQGARLGLGDGEVVLGQVGLGDRLDRLARQGLGLGLGDAQRRECGLFGGRNVLLDVLGLLVRDRLLLLRGGGLLLVVLDRNLLGDRLGLLDGDRARHVGLDVGLDLGGLGVVHVAGDRERDEHGLARGGEVRGRRHGELRGELGLAGRGQLLGLLHAGDRVGRLRLQRANLQQQRLAARHQLLDVLLAVVRGDRVDERLRDHGRRVLVGVNLLQQPRELGLGLGRVLGRLEFGGRRGLLLGGNARDLRGRSDGVFRDRTRLLGSMLGDDGRLLAERRHLARRLFRGSAGSFLCRGRLGILDGGQGLGVRLARLLQRFRDALQHAFRHVLGLGRILDLGDHGGDRLGLREQFVRLREVRLGLGNLAVDGEGFHRLRGRKWQRHTRKRVRGKSA